MQSRNTLGVVAVAALFFAAIAVAVAQEKAKSAGDEKKKDKTVKAEKPARPLCPVSGEPVNLAVSTTTDDGPVYFCCPKCVKAYEKDARKYAAKVKTQRDALHKLPAVQVTCPISGNPVDKKVSIDHAGHKIFFCCDKCPAKYKSDPAKYAKKLASCFTYQTHCAVMAEEEIDPKVSIKTDDGHTVYFCCKDCLPKFKADPAKYAKNLADQGYVLDLAKPAGEKDAHEKHDEHEGKGKHDEHGGHHKG